MSNIVLELKSIGKKYNGNYVLENINLKLKQGQILGLMGVNGSGKSTLLNIISGNSVIAQTGSYEGEILIDGKPVTISSVIESQSFGISMVHQEFNLMEDLTVWENIIMSQIAIRSSAKLKGTLKPFETEEKREKAEKILKRLGVSLELDTKVSDLPVNEKQFVEIARCISNEQTKILMLDEPTATLNKSDSAKLLEYLKNLAKTGLAIILISHRVEEIMEISDQILVIRDGKSVYFCDNPQEFQKEKIFSEIVGGHYNFTQRFRKNISRRDLILRYENFSAQRNRESLSDLNLDIYKSEIIGLSGMSGHGQNSLAYGTLGLCPVSGSVNLSHGERLLPIKEPSQSIEQGIVFVTEERRKNGLLMGKTVSDNINFHLKNFTDYFDKMKFSKQIKFFDRKKENETANSAIKKYDIVCNSNNQPVRELSGGNQQKVALARAILMKPSVLFINEPTRGIDIKSKENILNMLEKLNEDEGTTIILASGDMDELKKICDRICIFYDGRLEKIIECSEQN